MNKIWKQRQGAKLRLAVNHADTIKKAIEDSIDVPKVVDEWLNAHHTKEVTSTQARQWAKVNIHVDNRPMDKALKYLYADSYSLGQDIALQVLAKFSITKAAPTLAQMRDAVNTNWKTWEPGHKAASLLLNPPSGLAKLLDSRGLTLVGLGDTTVSRIGTILAGALQVGATPSSVAGSIEGLLAPLRENIAEQLGADINLMMADSERALMIAQTEMSRAVSVANLEMYMDSGVELVEWLTADPCDECQENEDVSPIGIGDTFPSGDTEPPAHPNCVCDIAPYVVDALNIGEDTLAFILEGN